MGQALEAELGLLSPVSPSSSDELPNAALLNRQKRQLAAAQKRRSSYSGPSTSTSSLIGYAQEEHKLSHYHPSNNLIHERLQDVQGDSRSSFVERRVSWRQQRARSAYDDVSEEIKSIPRAEWTQGRRPSWRQSTCGKQDLVKSVVENEAVSKSTAENKRAVEASAVNGEPLRLSNGNEEEGAGQVQQPLMHLINGRRIRNGQMAELGPASEDVRSAASQVHSENYTGRGGVGTSKAEAQERQDVSGAQPLDEELRTASNKSALADDLESYGLSAMLSPLEQDAEADSGENEQVTHFVNQHSVERREANEETHPIAAGGSAGNGLVRGGRTAVSKNMPDVRKEREGEKALVRGHTGDIPADMDKEISKGTPDTGLEEGLLVGSKQQTPASDGRGSITSRKKSASIAELKRLAAVAVPGRPLRRGSEIVDEDDVSGELERGRPDKLERDAKGQTGGSKGDSPDALEKSGACNKGRETSASISAQAADEFQESALTAEQRTGALTEGQEVKADATDTVEETGREQEMPRNELRGIVEDGKADSGDDRTPGKGKRRTSAEFLRGNWLSKAREIGAEWSVVRASTTGVSRDEGGGSQHGTGSGVEEEETVVKQVESAQTESAAKDGMVHGAKEEKRGRPATSKEEGFQGRLFGARIIGMGTVKSDVSKGREADRRTIIAGEEKVRGRVLADHTAEESPAVHRATNETGLQNQIRAEIDAAVESAAATWQAALAEKLLDRTRSLVSFEMTRVWDEVKQLKKQLRDESDVRDGNASFEIETLRSELGRIREELSRVRKEVRRDLEGALSGVREESEALGKGITAKIGEVNTNLREEVGREVAALRKEVNELRARTECPKELADNVKGRTQRMWPVASGDLALKEQIAKLEEKASFHVDSVVELRSRVSALENGIQSKKGSKQPDSVSSENSELRAKRIEEDLKALQSEMSERAAELQATVGTVRKQSEEHLKKCEEGFFGCREEAQELRGLVSGQGDVATRLDSLRKDLEQGLAGSNARIDKVERETRARERAFAQKLARLVGKDGELLEDVESRLPSPAAEKAEAVASASRRTEDQLARVEERIGMMLGLVTKDEAAEESGLSKAGANYPLDVPQVVLALGGRLELLERRTSQSVPLAEGLADRLAAVETALQELQRTEDTENGALGAIKGSESSTTAGQSDGKCAAACAQTGNPFPSLENRIALLEEVLLLDGGTIDCLSPKPSNPLSPKSLNLINARSSDPLRAKCPNGSKPAGADAKPRLASVERRLGGLEARLDALASNDASGAAALAETRARVQGLDKRVQGLHRDVDLEAQLSKRVAAAEWRLEQVATLVIANARALEAQVARAQEDSALAKHAADLASGKCGALAAELVRLSKQLPALTRERRHLGAAASAG